MHKLYELKEKLMNELEDYSENGKFSKDDVEAIKYTASAIDHICNIIEHADEEEYSMATGRYYDGSYARGGNMNMGGSYARGRGRNAKRDSMGRYSREGYSRAGEDIAMQLRDMMDDAPDEKIRMEIERLAKKVEQM